MEIANAIPEVWVVTVPLFPLEAIVVASVNVCPGNVRTNLPVPIICVTVPKFVPAAIPATVAVPPLVIFPVAGRFAPFVGLT